METFLPGDLTVAQLYGEYKGVLKTDLYRFSDAEDYIRAAKQVNATVRYDKISHNRLDPKQFSVEEYTSFEQMPLSQENYSLKSLILPDGMEEGWYLADISIPDGEENDWVQKLIQITNTSVYTQSLGGKLLVWLNDADTHQPMAGPDFRLQKRPNGGGCYRCTGHGDDRNRRDGGRLAVCSQG